MLRRLGFLSLGLSMVMSIFMTNPAMALNDDVAATLTMTRQGAGEFVVDDLDVGDTLILTLVNPTNKPLQFETTENVFNQKSFVVPANSQRVVTFNYTKPFSDDVTYVIREVAPSNVEVARNVLIHRETTTQTTQTGPNQYTETQTTRTTTTQTGGTTNVRGYW